MQGVRFSKGPWLNGRVSVLQTEDAGSIPAGSKCRRVSRGRVPAWRAGRMSVTPIGGWLFRPRGEVEITQVYETWIGGSSPSAAAQQGKESLL